MVIEELSRVDGSVGIIVAAHNSLCSNHIFKFGTEEQKKKYLVPLAQREKDRRVVADGAGSGIGRGRDANHCGARRECWVLNGAKTFTTNGSYADICVAMAVTDKSKGSHGICAFILEKGMAGFKPGRKKISWGCVPAILRK